MDSNAIGRQPAANMMLFGCDKDSNVPDCNKPRVVKAALDQERTPEFRGFFNCEWAYYFKTDSKRGGLLGALPRAIVTA